MDTPWLRGRIAGKAGASLGRMPWAFLCLPVETHSGTQQDARDYANSGKPNGRHGLRETKDDRHRRIANMLKDHPDWSLREVAGHCEVAPNTVKAVRDSICANCTDTPADNHDRTVTRNGTTYTMQRGSIGRVYR